MASQRVRLAESLPCCARVGWASCGKPAVVALGERNVYGSWTMRPLCAEHLQDVHQVGKQAVMSTTR
jgi:hypothetical protein